MPKPGFTYLGIILDRSGSMSTIREDMEGALNTFLAEQEQVPGECQVALIQFDDVIETVFAHLDIHKVGPIRLRPRNMTALLDAMGYTINMLGAHFNRLLEEHRPEKVLITTITDGRENASTEFSHEQIKAMIEEQQSKYNWSFTFLGANQDAVLVGESLGLGAHSSLTYAATGVSTRAMASSLSGATTRYRGAPANASFTYTSEEEQDVASTVDNGT